MTLISGELFLPSGTVDRADCSGSPRLWDRVDPGMSHASSLKRLSCLGISLASGSVPAGSSRQHRIRAAEPASCRELQSQIHSATGQLVPSTRATCFPTVRPLPMVMWKHYRRLQEGA